MKIRHRHTDRTDRGAAAKALLGSDFTESVLHPSTTRSHAARFQALHRGEIPTRTARIVNATDLGPAAGDDRNVVLTIELDGQFLAVSVLAGGARIPRIDDEIDVIVEPGTGLPLYVAQPRHPHLR